jgi:hypothetical protein
MTNLTELPFLGLSLVNSGFSRSPSVFSRWVVHSTFNRSTAFQNVLKRVDCGENVRTPHGDPLRVEHSV